MDLKGNLRGAQHDQSYKNRSIHPYIPADTWWNHSTKFASFTEIYTLQLNFTIKLKRKKEKEKKYKENFLTFNILEGDSGK